MSKPVSRLGRGLSTLISPRSNLSGAPTTPTPDSPAAVSASAQPATGIVEIPLGEIRPNANQPRRNFDETALEELAASIRVRGVLQPILVRPGATGFELVAGERRWRAAERAGLATIPAIVRRADELESAEVALIENIQREDLTALERARAYDRYLKTFQTTAEALAARLGQSRSTVVNHIRLLSLGAEIQAMLDSGELAMGQARAIAGVPDPRRQLAIAQKSVRRNLSTRQVEQLCRVEEPPESPAPREKPRHYSDVERALSQALGMPVRVLPSRKKNSGRIIIEYGGLEDFDRVFQKLAGRAALDEQV